MGQVTTYLLPVNSGYAVTVPPKESVGYLFGSSAPFTPGCTFNWEVTNGWLDFVGGPNQSQLAINARSVFFNNVNGNGKVKVTVSGCTSVTDANGNVTDGTPNNGKSSEVTVQIRYLGPVGDIKINGNTVVGSVAVSCGTHTASVDPVLNANYYIWELPNGWSGSSNTNTITFSTNSNTLSGIIRVTAIRNDASNFREQNKLVNISINNLPGAPNVSISGVPDSFICSGETVVATASGANASSYNWTTTGSLLVNGSNSATGSTVTFTGSGGNGNGGFVVSTYSADCNISSPNTTGGFYTGTPTIGATSANGNTFNGGLCNGYGVQLFFDILGATSYSGWSITSSNGQNAYLSDYGINSLHFNSYTNDCYGIDTQLTNRCGTSGAGVTICVYDCSGGRIATTVSSVKAYPNPAKNLITVELLPARAGNNSTSSHGPTNKGQTKTIDEITLKSQNVSDLPNRIDLVSEKNGLVFSFNGNDSARRKILREGNKLDIDVSSFPRGVYYIHIVSSDKSAESKVEKVRVLLQ